MTDLRALNAKKTVVDSVVIDMFENRKNKNNTSGYKGVYQHGQGYIARICVKGRHYHAPT